MKRKSVKAPFKSPAWPEKQGLRWLNSWTVNHVNQRREEKAAHKKCRIKDNVGGGLVAVDIHSQIVTSWTEYLSFWLSVSFKQLYAMLHGNPVLQRFACV